MKKERKFRKCLFGGFNKSDVIDYIEQLMTRSNDTEITLNDKIKELETAAAQAEEKLNEAEQKAADAQLKLEAEKGISQTLASQNAEYAGKVNDINEKLSKTNAELEICRQNDAESQGKIDELEQKSQKYDEMSTRIGNVMIDAHNYADKVIEVAKKEVSQLSFNSVTNIEQLTEDISSLRSDIDSVGDSVAESVKNINERLAALCGEMNKTVQKLQPEKVSEMVSAAVEPIKFNENVQQPAQQNIQQPKNESENNNSHPSTNEKPNSTSSDSHQFYILS